MTDDSQKLREAEADWLKNQMNLQGISNLELHQRLGKAGFQGRPNNISMWTTARTSIPNEWLGVLATILCPDAAERRAIDMFSDRMPYLRPLFKSVEPTADEPTRNRLTPHAEPHPSLADANSPAEIYYIAKRGKLKGKMFVPHRNRNGKFQGGYSRFKKDIEEFDSLADLSARLRSNPEFKIRMSPTDTIGPPSLIASDSLVFE